MIKWLRLKFLCISMLLVTVLLVAILGLIYHFTWLQMEKSTVTTLRNYSQQAIDHNGPGKPGGPHSEALRPKEDPCFTLTQLPSGQISAVGSTYYDLSDQEALQKIFQAAQSTGLATGVLEEYALCFYRAEEGPGERYVFTDISAQRTALKNLKLTCLAIGVAAYLLFFGLMWLLSTWMVRPVARAWDQQRQFVADASHELKTPLTVILTNLELLESENFDNEAKGRFVSSIQTMATQMRGLVEGLLDLARIDNRSLRRQMEPLCFSTLAEDTSLLFEAMYYEAGRTLETDIEPGLTVCGIREHLRQVIEILLDNGRKYALPGSTVTLKLVKSGHRAELCVASEGETLTRQQCKDIFKRFYRVDAARKMNHSYGLGLSIAQNVLEAHKGKIWCESKDGINTFYVNLPLRN